MSEAAPLSLFFAAPPGLETLLAEEVAALGFQSVATTGGGVTAAGDWASVQRAHLLLRGATRVLVRIGEFHAAHLAQLDKRARKLPWAAFLRPDVAVKVEASTKKSRIYHSGAAAQRIERAISEELGAPISKEASLTVMARLENDLCTISLDASGEPLHKRGHRTAVGKAPLRESMAALMLRACGYDGAEPVIDPMCGAGTFVLEAADIAAGLPPGRDRSFAFEHLASFDAAAWAAMQRETQANAAPPPDAPRYFGFDRDAGAIESSRANADRAGLAAFTSFARQPISDLTVPEPLRGGPPGLVMVNPPYGARIGEAGDLRALYGTLGKVLRENFSGWRVGLVTSEPALARAAALPFQPPGPPIAHGGLRVKLYRTGPLP